MPVADATTGGRLRGLLLRGEQGVGRGLGKQAKAARRVAKAIWHARRAAQGSRDARRVGGTRLPLRQFVEQVAGFTVPEFGILFVAISM